MHLAIADGIGMGLGFTMSLTFLGSIREILGAGTWFGHPVMWDGFQPFTIMVEAPGAFLCLGLTLAAMNYGTHRQLMKKSRENSEELPSPCGGCRACALGRSNKD